MDYPNNSWVEARTDFDDFTLPVLEKYGKQIGLAASKGNEKAKKIVKYYKMLHISFDPMISYLLNQELLTYLYPKTTKKIRKLDNPCKLL